MRLQDKLDDFLAGRGIRGARGISRGKAKRLGHKTNANTKFYTFEESSHLGGTWHVDGPNVTARGFIGAYSYINGYSYVRNDVFIGRYSSIGCRVSIGAHRHPISALSTSLNASADGPSRAYSDGERDSVRFYRNNRRAVVIGSDVWIGDGAVVMPGVKVADGAVIGANAVVTQDVAAYEIVAGVPARPIGRRFEHRLAEQLIASEWWDYPNHVLRALPTGNVFEFLERFGDTRADPADYETFWIRRPKDAVLGLFRGASGRSA